MTAKQTKNTNSRFRHRKNNNIDYEQQNWNRFIDSDTKHFLYNPDYKENYLSERTQNLSPDIALFTVLAGNYR